MNTLLMLVPMVIAGLLVAITILQGNVFETNAKLATTNQDCWIPINQNNTFSLLKVKADYNNCKNYFEQLGLDLINPDPRIGACSTIKQTEPEKEGKE